MTWLITNNAREHYLAGINTAHPDNVPTLAEIGHSLALYDPLIHQPWPVIDTPGHVHAPMDYELDSSLRGNTQWYEWAAMFVSRANGLNADIAKQVPA